MSRNGKKTTHIFSKIIEHVKRNRLGETLVMRGLLTTRQLHEALLEQKKTAQPLGEILIQRHIITRAQLKNVLLRQTVMRALAAALFLSVSIGPVGKKDAHADMIKDVPSRLSVGAPLKAEFTKMAAYPPLFGSEEKASYNLKPFTKWTEMFERFDKSLNSKADAQVIDSWKHQLSQFRDQSLPEMAASVNKLVNKVKYVSDSRNWGRSDYWETPVEFLERGGDCEDYAIAKYTALRALGVPEDRLRVAIVHDKEKDMPHAILVVYTSQGALILDNQNKDVLNAATYNRYRPIFSINRQAWWLHNAPQKTIIASAN